MLSNPPTTLEEATSKLNEAISDITSQMLESMPQVLASKDDDDKETAMNLATLANNINTIKTQNEEMAKIAEIEKKQMEDSRIVAADVARKAAEIESNTPIITSEPNLLQTNSKFLTKVDYVMGTEMAGSCVSSFLSVIPSTFCYKKGGDAGVIPTGCPDGWFRSLALCYEECKSGYSFVAGVCWEKCRSGYTDLGASCFKWNWFKSKTYFKSTYIPSSMTNFDSRIPCDDGYYKSGALCYRDCNNIYLENCGIGACAANSASCAAGIIQTVVDVTMGAVQFAAFVASFGASSSAQGGFAEGKSALKTAFDRVKSKASSALSIAKRVANSPSLRKKFFEQSIKKFSQAMLKKGLEVAAQEAVIATCTSIGNQMFDDMKDKTNPLLNAESWDITGISSAVSSCDKKLSTENDKIQCAKAVMGVISNVDPTGLVSIAAGLMNDICDV
jgi:hypothetical protein